MNSPSVLQYTSLPLFYPVPLVVFSRVPLLVVSTVLMALEDGDGYLL
jgi:hypothetical protein